MSCKDLNNEETLFLPHVLQYRAIQRFCPQWLWSPSIADGLKTISMSETLSELRSATMAQPSWHLEQCPWLYRCSVNLKVKRTEAEWMDALKHAPKRANELFQWIRDAAFTEYTLNRSVHAIPLQIEVDGAHIHWHCQWARREWHHHVGVNEAQSGSERVGKDE